jgi:hypothetical protein
MCGAWDLKRRVKGGLYVVGREEKDTRPVYRQGEKSWYHENGLKFWPGSNGGSISWHQSIFLYLQIGISSPLHNLHKNTPPHPVAAQRHSGVDSPTQPGFHRQDLVTSSAFASRIGCAQWPAADMLAAGGVVGHNARILAVY